MWKKIRFFHNGIAMSPRIIKGSSPHSNNQAWIDRHALQIMMWPANLFTFLIIGLALVFATALSFTNLKFGSTTPLHFIGLNNYIHALKDPLFWTAMRVTLTIFFVSLTLELIIGTWMGILLSSPLPGMRFFRVLSLLPFIMPPVASGLVWLQLFNPVQGVLNYFLRSLGLTASLWLAHPKTVILSLILVEVWESTPFIALIIVGAMYSMPSEPFEAAIIDGASKFDLIRYITIPLLYPAIVVAAILRSVDLLRILDSIYILTHGGPVNHSLSLNFYGYLQGFLNHNMAYGSAIMIILLLLVVLISFSLSRIQRNYIL
jgi:multiple sugar transport system permease protein